MGQVREKKLASSSNKHSQANQNLIPQPGITSSQDILDVSTWFRVHDKAALYHETLSMK